MSWKKGDEVIYGGKKGKVESVNGDRCNVRMYHGGLATDIPVKQIKKA